MTLLLDEPGENILATTEEAGGGSVGELFVVENEQGEVDVSVKEVRPRCG